MSGVGLRLAAYAPAAEGVGVLSGVALCDRRPAGWMASRRDAEF